MKGIEEAASTVLVPQPAGGWLASCRLEGQSALRWYYSLLRRQTASRMRALVPGTPLYVRTYIHTYLHVGWKQWASRSSL